MSAPNLLDEPLLPESRAYLDLVHTHSCITTKSSEIFRSCGITEQQFHVLRILDAAGPGGLPCLEVARQLPTPAPDITRLLERMRRAGLIQRQRLEADRRVILIDLREKGRSVLAAVLPRLAEFHRERLSHMTERELEQLGLLLRKARGEI